MGVAYPNFFPSEALRSAIAAFSSGQITQCIPQLAYDLWQVQGYVQGALLPVPGQVSVSHALGIAPPDDHEARLVELATHLVAYQQSYDGPGLNLTTPVDATAVNLILQLVCTLAPLILEFIRSLRKPEQAA